MKNDNKRHEAHKFADSAVRAREDEEGYGRLRMALFVGMLGPLACAAIKFMSLTPPKQAVWGILATMPASILLLIMNYIRLPNRLKAGASALTMLFMTLASAGATFVLYHLFSIGSFLKAS